MKGYRAGRNTLRQQGVTLVEVLVGFVIFMSTLVVVLDYVSEQIFHTHRTKANLEQLQFIYQLSSVQPYLEELRSVPEWHTTEIEWNYSMASRDSFKQRNKELSLNKIEYWVEDNGQRFKWDVIYFE